jgi:hypothetical protein
MRGLKRHRSARILAAGHAFVQNLRRGHYDIATDIPIQYRLRMTLHSPSEPEKRPHHALVCTEMAQRNSAA